MQSYKALYIHKTERKSHTQGLSIEQEQGDGQPSLA